MYEWKRECLFARCDLPCVLSEIKFHPTDHTQFIGCGPKLCRLWRYIDNSLEIYPPFAGLPAGCHINSMDWISNDSLVLVSETGESFVIQDGHVAADFKSREISASERAMPVLDSAGLLSPDFPLLLPAPAPLMQCNCSPGSILTALQCAAVWHCLTDSLSPESTGSCSYTNRTPMQTQGKLAHPPLRIGSRRG